MKKSDIKSLVKESLREAFYTKKRLITEGFSLIVGTIDADGHVNGEEASKSGRTHRELFGGSDEGEQDWRYSELTKVVYWKEDHPEKFEELVQAWLENEGFLVRNHITLENIEDRELYQKLWYDAHGKGIRFEECDLSEECIEMLTESLNEYLQDVDNELELWLEDYDKFIELWKNKKI